ncbi:hypothetical protein HGH93_21450 [Chitinophaga polysaccharea]|uniref:hypothetical protein n=1 Tax=Chitinophaga polysaccharea TaxID=1293035 RepID=UPI0014558665|nr:hypothetical protein [Chitinophaga polysaccharea]NLR60690.1 hypothetical protein [Chitinophaga polysaccharea]
MIQVEELLYDIDLRLNKVATSAHQHINLEDKLISLNDAQLILIKQKVAGLSSRPGLDGSKKRYDDIENLVTTHCRLPVSFDTDSVLYSWSGSLESLPAKYMFFVDAYFVATKGSCKDRILHGYRIKHADLQVVMNNSNTCPSFEYQEMPLTITADRLYGYTDGSYTISDAYISFVRYPVKIDMEGYIGFDGAPSITANCELNNFLKDELVDIAVQLLAMSTENVPATQFADVRLSQKL